MVLELLLIFWSRIRFGCLLWIIWIILLRVNVRFLVVGCWFGLVVFGRLF